MDFWQNVLAACAALLILIAIMGVVYAIYSAVKANKQKAYFAELQWSLWKAGSCWRGDLRRRGQVRSDRRGLEVRDPGDLKEVTH